MENPCGESFIRGAAALVRVGCDGLGHSEVGSGVHGEIPFARAANARGHAQAIVRRGAAVQFEWWGDDFEPQSQPARPLLRSSGRLQVCGMVTKCR